MNNNVKGIQVKKFINVEDTVELLIVAKNVVYSDENLEEFKAQFQILKIENVFKNDNFDENIWISHAYDGKVTLKFDLFSAEKTNRILKSYVVVKMNDGGICSREAQKILRIAKKYLLKTNFLNRELDDVFMNSIHLFSDQEKLELISFREFLNFANIENSEEYIKIIDGVSFPQPKYRKIPNYQSILMFDVILKNYIANTIVSEQEKYFPLVLWWKITTILPLRPIEFCSLKKNCCYFDENQKCYFLEVERKKIKNSKIKIKEIPIINKIKVTEEVFDIIQKYKSLTSSNSNEYLLSQKSYRKFLKTVELDLSNEISREDQSLTTAQMRTLLQNFYDEIIRKEFKYNVVEKTIATEDHSHYEIQRMQLGDTRHIAMCGLLLQGFNPLTIAKLAGHSTLRDQMNYFNHMQSYLDANVFVLAKNIKLEFETNYVDLEAQRTWKKDVIERKILNEEFHFLRQVEGGKCRSNNFPSECTLDGCLFCRDHFIHDNSLTPELVENYMKIKDEDIKNKIDCLKNIMKNMIIHDNETHDLEHQKMLKTTSNQLRTFINQRGLLEAYKLSLEED